jgi:hypothetical protein
VLPGTATAVTDGGSGEDGRVWEKSRPPVRNGTIAQDQTAKDKTRTAIARLSGRIAGFRLRLQSAVTEPKPLSGDRIENTSERLFVSALCLYSDRGLEFSPCRADGPPLTLGGH